MRAARIPLFPLPEREGSGAAFYDERRAVFLEGLGWQVRRFWNNDVRDDADGIAEAILSAVALRVGRPRP